MEITGIREYDRRRKRIELDGGEQSFLLYLGELRRLRLSEGDILTEERWERIREEILKPRARKRVLAYLKTGDKSSAEVRTKLKQGLYPEEVIEDALSFLAQYKLLDDIRYAENYIEELRGKKSKREIEAKLYAKGLSGSMVRELLSEGLEEEDEYAACWRALRQKLGRQLSGELTTEERKKLYGFLMRKGFSYDAVEHCLRELSEERPLDH